MKPLASSSHTAARQLFRDRIFLPLLRSRAVQKRLTRRLSQLDMNYRGASLSEHQESGLLGRVRVRAGDRAPDVAFRDARTGAETSLFASLANSRLIALFGPGRDPAGAGARPTKNEQLMEALGNLGVECFLILPASTRQSGEGLIDVSGDFHRLYDARGEFLNLIRPDGYVGLFQRPLDECVLQAYMAKLFRVDAVHSAFAAQAIRVPVEAGR